MRLFYCTCLSWAYCCTCIVGSLGNYTNASSETIALSGNLTSVASSTAERECWIAAPTVQVLYFPPGNRTTLDATTVVSSNYTFTSPSLYVVYPTISAQDIWEPSGIPLKSQIGGVYYNVTRAYPPSALRTFPALCYHGFLAGTQGPPTLKVEDLIHPPQNWITGQLCEMVMGHIPGHNNGGSDQHPNPNGTEMAAFPNLLLPEEMSTYDPAWSGCIENTAVYPVWDPPRALTPAAVMAPSTTSQRSGPPSTADPEGQSAIPMSITRPATIPSTPATPAGPGDFPKITRIAGVIPAADDGADDEHGNPDQEPDVAYTSTKRTEEADPPIIEPPSRSVVVIGHHTVYALQDGTLSVDSMRITPGASEITVDGLPVSQDDSAIYVAGSSYMSYSASVLPSLYPPPVGGQHMEAKSDGKVVIGDVTIAPGSQATIAGTPISVDALYVVYGSSTYAKPPVSRIDVSGFNSLKSVQNADDPGFGPAPADNSATPMVTPPPLFADQKIRKLANGAILVGGSTIPLGAQVTVSNTPISVGSSVVVVGGTTYGLPISIPPSLPILPNGQRIWRDSNGDVVIGSVTLSPGSQTTIAGTPVSVGSTLVAVAGSTFDLAPSRPTYTVPLIDGQTVTEAPDGAVVIGSLTLGQGSQTTISGTALSVGSNKIMIDGTPYALPLPTEKPIYIDGQSFERLPDGNVVVDDGQILNIGAQTTISGLPISVGVTDVVIAGTTYAVANQPTSTAAVGAMIASMFGFVSAPTDAVGSAQNASGAPGGSWSNSTSGAGSEVFLGVGARRDVDVWVLLLSWLGGVAFSAAL